MPEDRIGSSTRRRVLQTVFASVLVGLGGCARFVDEPTPRGNTSTTPQGRGQEGTDADSPLGEDYRNVINVIDRGVDPTGEEPILPQLGDVGDDVLLFFPEGRYLLANTWDLSKFDRLALVGNNATIVPRKGDQGVLMGTSDVIQSLRVEGVTVDNTTPQTGPRPMNVQVNDNLFITDFTIEGSTKGVRFDITSPDGSGIVRRMRLTDGGLPQQNSVGCLVTPKNKGSLRFDDCLIDGFPNNGLYASSSEGPVTVQGGRYSNNGIANVRVSGPSTVSDVRVECTRSPEEFRNMRGIWVRGGDCSITDCDLNIEKVTYSDGAIVGNWDGEVRNTRIRVDTNNTPAIWVRPSNEQANAGIDFADVQISGTAANGQAILVVDYEPCHFDNLSVEQKGPDRTGFYLIRSDGSEITNTTIDVSGRAVYTEESEITRSNVSISEMTGTNQ